MRIAFVTSEYVTEEVFDGGLSNYIHRVVLALKSRGHDPVVFVNANRNEIFMHREIEIHRVDCRLPHELVKLHLNVLKKLYRFGCKQYWPDIYKKNKKLEYDSHQLNHALFHTHQRNPFDIVQYASSFGSALCRHPSIPSVVRVSSYTPLLDIAHDRIGDSYRNECEVIAYNRSDAVFSPSSLIASQLNKVLGHEIPVIESPFYMEADKLDDSLLNTFGLRTKQYLLFFGTVSLYKGCLTIAKCLNRLFSECPQQYFVFVGKTIPYNGKDFETLIREKVYNEYQDRVIFSKKASHSQLYPIIQSANGVILPSRMDNLPNTCLEAMGLGKIVVGTRGASFDQLIHDGENGFLCEIDDHDGLFDAIKKLLSLSQEQVWQMSDAAQKRIQRLCPDIAIPSLLDFYRIVIARHAQSQITKNAA